MCADLWLRWGNNQSCSPHWELSNDMWHATWKQGNQSDSWLLVVKSQIDNLIPDLSFGHNLCFKYPNGSCKLILDIYVPRTFQWYKEPFNPMGFDSCNCFLKIWKSIWTSTPKVGAHLGVREFIPSHSPTLSGIWNVIPRFHSWLAPSQAFALVVSPKLVLPHDWFTLVRCLNWKGLAKTWLYLSEL